MQSSLRRLSTSLMIRLSASIDSIERPFTPDGTKDLGSAWKRQGVDQITPDTRRLAKPNALMFFHIPLYASLFLAYTYY